MANKTTSFKKKGKGKERGTSKKNSKQVAAPMKKPKARHNPGTECFYYKEMVTGSGTALDTWQIRRMAKRREVYLIYMLLMCTLLVFIATLSI